MRVAVLNDIHGNLPALEAVLEEIRRDEIDRIVVGGDVFPGPMADLALQRLLDEERPVDFLYGNGEVAVLEHLQGRVPARVPESHRAVVQWNAERLDARQRDALRQWPLTVRRHVPSFGGVLFCHATPRNEHEIFTERTAEARLLPIMASADARLIVCGHTHMPFDRRVGNARVVNAGSVGMPFGPAGADWVILGSDVEFRHTEYDLDDAAERIRRSGYPAADEFAAKYVLNPPAAADMLALYSAHELT